MFNSVQAKILAQKRASLLIIQGKVEIVLTTSFYIKIKEFESDFSWRALDMPRRKSENFRIFKYFENNSETIRYTE